jgi:hypothetical protein
MDYLIIASDIEVQNRCPVCDAERHVPIAEVYIGGLKFLVLS